MVLLSTWLELKSAIISRKKSYDFKGLVMEAHVTLWNFLIYGNFRDFFDFWTLTAIFKFNMASRKPGGHLKTFLRLVASSWLNMSPWRTMATPFMLKISKCYEVGMLTLLQLTMFFFKNEFMVTDRPSPT